MITICEPVLAETLKASNVTEYAETEHDFRDLFVYATVPDGIWNLVAAIRRELAPHGAHHGPSVADLVIAATAIRLKLEVLHEDGDFETVARFVPEVRQRRISAAV